MPEGKKQSFDVVIMGAGFAGLCQARHLLLNVPDIRVAIIDRRNGDEDGGDFKVGESTVEISAMFLYKELGLYQDLIDNHPPRYGLNFHWPKDGAKTDQLDDYHHIWTNRQPSLPSFQINRARFERDLTKMNKESGAVFVQGKVVDFVLGEDGARHSVEVKRSDGEMISLDAAHLIDAAGRKFLIGRKIDNIITDEKELCGLRTGSAWLRVKNLDRSIFHDGYDPLSGVASHFYGTNHFLGKAHWIWMIPIERETQTVSIGVVHHLSEIEGKQLNSRDKFLKFVAANHGLVKRLIDSGEVVDFKYLPRLTHISRRMMSNDNWYVIGDAANMLDPFYSAGLVIAAVNITGVTEVIRSKMAEEYGAEKKCDLFDQFNLNFAKVYNNIYRDHDRHLGNAGVMSWRIYMENMTWFGILIPMFVGKWHFDRMYIRSFLLLVPIMFFGRNSIFKTFYREFTHVEEEGKNIGMMDYARADQLCMGFVPTGFGDTFLENAIYEDQRINVFKGMKKTFFYMMLLFLKLRWRSRGIASLFMPSTWAMTAKLFGLTLIAGAGAIHHWAKNLFRPSNQMVCDAKMDFKENYRRQAELQSW